MNVAGIKATVLNTAHQIFTDNIIIKGIVA